MVPRFLILLGLATLILLGLHYYIFERASRYLALAASERRLLKIGLSLLFILVWTAMPLGRLLTMDGARPLFYAAFIWLGCLVMMALGLFIGDLLRWLSLVAPVDAERRLWLGRVVGQASLGLGSLLSGYALFQGLRQVAVKRVTVPVPGLPRALDGLRIVQITDVHIGPTLRGGWLRRVVDTINGLRPDLIAITGDLVDGPVAALRPHVAPLSELKSRHGTFFVTGNHEYYAGANEWIAELRRLGLQVLRNERVSVVHDAAAAAEGSLDIAGVDDFHSHSFPGHGPDLARAVEGRQKNRPLVLLAHQPAQIHEAVEHGVTLQLSGHTHGGQLWPWGFFVRLQQPFIAGLHRIGQTFLYVSCGTGYWGPPMRLNAPAEITELCLRSEPTNSAG
jgi:predicted MPP superfamily phosphohydrolase